MMSEYLKEHNSEENDNDINVYALLGKLCDNLLDSPNDQRSVFRHVSQYLSNCPTALGNKLPFDENSLVSKILQHLNVTQNNHSGQNGDIVSTSRSLSSLFLNMHEQLKASQINAQQRSALITFLFYMADSKYLIENNFNKMPTSSTAMKHASTSMTNSSQVKPHRIQITRNPIFHASGKHDSKSTPPNYTAKKIAPPVIYHNLSDYEIKSSFELGSSEQGKDVAIQTNLRPTIRPIHSSTSLTSLSSKQISLYNGDNTKILNARKFLNDDVVQNIIYAFTGIESKYLIKDLTTGRFKLHSAAKSLNIVQAGMLLRLADLGYYHNIIKSFTETNCNIQSTGLMVQAFVSALKSELTKYYGMVAMLQEQFNKQHLSEENKTFLQGSKCSFEIPQQNHLSLMKILAWSVEPLQRLQWLVKILKACEKKKGGELASIVYSFENNGNPMVKALCRELLSAVCGPFYQMLTRWLLEGEICDPYTEFFIECLPGVRTESLWHDKYRVHFVMLPSFISVELAQKILVTGKNINFLCEVCEDQQPVKDRDVLRHFIKQYSHDIFSFVGDTKLHSIIDQIYLNTSKRVLDVVMGPHKLFEHLQALRRYLLLGQGDFIGLLMESLKCELDKPAKELYAYDLSSLMNSAIRSTNAQFDNAGILNHLDLRLLSPCDGDVGWDIISLQYTVRGPLATMLEPSMRIYQLLFKPLWRMKHMEFVLSSKIWKNQQCNAKPLRPMSAELNEISYRLHLFTSEMIHFIHQMEYYILFEVIECSWVELKNQIHQAKTLDEILCAHDIFLETIRCGAFLDSSSEILCQNMETVYEGITRLEVWQSKFYDVCFKELKARKQMAIDVSESEKIGDFGLSTEKCERRELEKKIFEQIIASYCKSLENISSDYEKAVRSFLLSLNSHNDTNLQLFGVRLDFNEYYKKRDQRLGVPLTFEHMRFSNIYLNNINKSQLSNSRLLNIN